jgi:hypothetical protein
VVSSTGKRDDWAAAKDVQIEGTAFEINVHSIGRGPYKFNKSTSNKISIYAIFGGDNG